MTEQTLYVTLGEIPARMGVGIVSGRKELKKMREHPQFPQPTVGGKYYWPLVADFIDFWNGRSVKAPGIAAGQGENNGQTPHTGRARPRLAAAKERLGGRVAG